MSSSRIYFAQVLSFGKERLMVSTWILLLIYVGNQDSASSDGTSDDGTPGNQCKQASRQGFARLHLHDAFMLLFLVSRG